MENNTHFLHWIIWDCNSEEVVSLQSVMTRKGPVAMACLCTDHNRQVRMQFGRAINEWFYHEFLTVFANGTKEQPVLRSLNRTFQQCREAIPDMVTVILLYKKRYIIAYNRYSTCFVKRKLHFHRRIRKNGAECFSADCGHNKSLSFLLVSDLEYEKFKKLKVSEYMKRIISEDEVQRGLKELQSRSKRKREIPGTMVYLALNRQGGKTL